MRSQQRQQNFVEVVAAVVESKLTLFQMKQKLVLAEAIEFLHSPFCE